MTKYIAKKSGLAISFAFLFLFLVVSQFSEGFSQTQTNTTTPQSVALPVGYPVYWNGSGWAKLSSGQQTENLSSTYWGITSITLPDYPVATANFTYPNPTDVSNALNFFSNILGLDLTHYSAQLMPSLPEVDLSSKYQNIKTEHLMLYSINALNSTDGTIDISFMANNQGKIFSLDIGPLSREKPFFTSPQTSVQNQALQFLERYANYSGESYIGDVSNLITTYGIANPLTAGIGDTTFQIINVTNDPNTPYITFTRAPETINNTYDGIDLSYQNGVLVQFIDFWNRMPIGSFDVNINQSVALQIAEQAAKAYSFTYNNSTVSNFTLSSASNAVICNLQMQPRNSSLYPLYGFSLGLNGMNPDGITELQVGVWADTGQVSEVNYVSSYGGPSGASATIQPDKISSANLNNENNSAQSIDTVTIVLAAVAATAITLSIIVLRNRKAKRSR